jgi:hypothetical protein
LEGNNNGTSLTSERMEALNKIGFDWGRFHESSWEKRYNELVEYNEKHGYSHVPQDYDENFALGQWCMNQRTQYPLYQAGERTGLTADRIEKLETICFQWSHREMQWQTMFLRLKAYQAEHGHLNIGVPEKKNTDLRMWLIWQRHTYNRQRRPTESSSPMTAERISMFESIPDFSWRGRENSGPSKVDWSNLFVAMKEKGIEPGMRPKQHWFEGQNPLQVQVKSEWTESEIVDLWNQGDDDD